VSGVLGLETCCAKAVRIAEQDNIGTVLKNEPFKLNHIKGVPGKESN
jgi:hypothetical protein